MTRRRLRLVGMLSIALVATLGCGHSNRDEETPGPASNVVVAVRVRPLEMRRFEDAIAAPGTWRSSGELVIVAPFAATVQGLRTRVGDRVQRGETVGWLITRESQSALRGAELLSRQASDSSSRAEAKRALELARRDLVRVPLIAPAAGLVLRRSAEVGSQVGESSEILAIAPLGSIVFEARVAPRDAGRLARGERATILVQGLASRPAILDRILPSPGAGDQATLAWLSPIPGRALPELGRFGTAHIVVGSARMALAVPDSALVEDDLTGEIRIAEVGPDQLARWRKIELGAAAPGFHELKSPALPAGSRVIIEGQRGLPDSTRVRVGP